MSRRRIDALFWAVMFIGIMIFVLGFHAFNRQQSTELPETNGTFSEWGINSCDIGKNYVLVSGWAAPKDAIKLNTEVYLNSVDNKSFYKVKTLVYQRGHETEEMKAKQYFDNSGFVSSLRLPMQSEMPGKKITIVSLGRDGNWYRGEYDCSK
ncbi:hypothetical protein ACR3LR_08595 [Pantoea eucalypti]|uniref:hypothetical protein n=1 Tax=Pantoea eucalypti TaxID=470933 RepID=UPI003EE4B7B9